jgi:hypothetical protein
MDRGQVRPGAYIIADGGPVEMTASMTCPGPVRHGRPPEDMAAEWDGHVSRISAVLDKLAELKKAKADHEDFRDLIWRLGGR